MENHDSLVKTSGVLACPNQGAPALGQGALTWRKWKISDR